MSQIFFYPLELVWTLTNGLILIAFLPLIFPRILWVKKTSQLYFRAVVRLRLAIFWLEMWRVNPTPRRIYCVFYFTFWNKGKTFKRSEKQQPEFTQKLMRHSLKPPKKEWTAIRLLDDSFWKPIDEFQLKIATVILKTIGIKQSQKLKI